MPLIPALIICVAAPALLIVAVPAFLILIGVAVTAFLIFIGVTVALFLVYLTFGKGGNDSQRGQPHRHLANQRPGPRTIAKEEEERKRRARVFQWQHYNTTPAPSAHVSEVQRPFIEEEIGLQSADELRAKATKAGDAMARFFEQARAARAGGDRTASTTFDTAHAYKREMERLNKAASRLIIKESERRCIGRPGLIDLHGLYVSEAIEYTEESIQAAINRGDPQIRIIVGKGIHSKDSIARLKPKIEEWLLSQEYLPNLDPSGGMFVVELKGQASYNKRRDF